MPIAPETYGEEYFRSDKCEGWSRFREDRGLSSLKAYEIELLEPGPDLDVLDAGCGRGEVLLACAARGARVAGIDYSDAALAISHETLAGIHGTDLRSGRVTALPWPDASFDRALLGDVIEHLDPSEARAALAELHRVLRPAGRLVVHTAPNLRFLRYGWPLSRLALRVIGQSQTVARVDGWIGESKRYHVNEQSTATLGRALREAGFSHPRVWIAPEIARGGDHHLTSEVSRHPVASRLTRLAGRRPLRDLLGNDVYAIAVREPTG